MSTRTEYSVQNPDGGTYGVWDSRNNASYYLHHGHPRDGDNSMSAPYEPKPPEGSILVERIVTYGDWVPESTDIGRAE